LPNVASVEWRSPGMVDDPAARSVPASGSVRDRVLTYLAARLPAEDRQREGLLGLAAAFLDQEGHR
jgi:hypothetical protein